jgi:hypothetical protein
MTAIGIAGHTTSWSVASAIGTSSRIFFGHFVMFAGIALAAYAPGTVSYILRPDSRRMVLIGLVTGQIMMIMLVYGTVQALRGEKVSVSACPSTGLRRFGVALVASILAGIGTGLAFLLLVLPGFVVITMWSLVVPVVTIEQQGILASLPRSAFLTRGRRWRIFGALVACILLAAVILMVAAVIAVLLERTTNLYSTDSAIITEARIVFSIIHAYFTCLLATLYYFLRREKEGIDVDHVAKAFD